MRVILICEPELNRVERYTMILYLRRLQTLYEADFLGLMESQRVVDLVAH